MKKVLDSSSDSAKMEATRGKRRQTMDIMKWYLQVKFVTKTKEYCKEFVINEDTYMLFRLAAAKELHVCDSVIFDAILDDFQKELGIKGKVKSVYANVPNYDDYWKLVK